MEIQRLTTRTQKHCLKNRCNTTYLWTCPYLKKLYFIKLFKVYFGSPLYSVLLRDILQKGPFYLVLFKMYILKTSILSSSLRYILEGHFIQCFEGIFWKKVNFIQWFLRYTLEVHFIQCFLRYIWKQVPFYPMLFKEYFESPFYPVLLKVYFGKRSILSSAL